MAVMPGLSVHLARLDRAIENLGPEGLADTLRRHVHQLRPAERDAFVAMFEATAPAGDASLLDEVAATVEDLPQVVDELVDDRWRRRRRHRWDDPWAGDGEASVVRGSVDDLYRRLGERFLAGDTATAVEGYRRLLDAAAAAVDDPGGVHVSGSEDIAREGFARLARALLEDTSQSPGDRVAAAVEALDGYHLVVPVPTVAEVLDARPDGLAGDGGLAGDEEILEAWLDASEREARARLSWEGRPFHNWLVDLVARRDGTDGLARLASDATYPHRVQAYHSWIDQLEEVGRIDDAVAAAVQAVEALDVPAERARLADRLAGLHRSAGDRGAAVAAGSGAVRDDPTLYRLRCVLDDARAAGLDERRVASDLVAAVDAHGDASPLVRVAVLVLAARLEHLTAVIRGDGRSGRVWHEHRASDVVAAGALLLGCRPAADDVAARLGAGLVDTVDDPRLDEHRRAMLALARRGGRTAEPGIGPGPLGPVLRESIAATAADVARLQHASDVVAATADSVLGAKERADYATVARMVVALAHTAAAVDGTPAEQTIADYDLRFRRFSAFRAELRTASEHGVSGPEGP